jgi:rieske iron-sulfur protein
MLFTSYTSKEESAVSNTVDKPNPSRPGEEMLERPIRRNLMRAAGTMAFTCLAGGCIPIARADDKDTRPKPGNRLVLADAEGGVTPLRVADVPLNGKPLHAFPYAPVGKLVQDGSRMNKIALIRLDPASLSKEMATRAVDGVLAFSAICTHQGCDVTEFLVKENALMCFCHFSKFDVMNEGSVIAGPSPRNLPYLQLAVEDGELVVAREFSATPGVKKSG